MSVAILQIAVVWLCFCSVQWTAEATYSNTYFQPPPIINKFRPAEPFCPPNPNVPYSVVAFFDMNGIRGNVSFYQPRRGGPVTVVARLDGLDQFGDDEMWGWHVHECPINFALLDEFPCSTASVGGHFDPDNRISNVNYSSDCSPSTPAACELGDLSGRFGRLRPDQSVYHFQLRERGFGLYGPYSFVGRSIVIHRTDGFRWACANIEYDGHNRLDTFVARFPKNPKQQENTLQGDVVMKRSEKRAGVTISGVLSRVDGGPRNTSHRWNLRPGTCDSLSDTVYGSYGPSVRLPYQHLRCSETRQRDCIIGDLSSKCGMLQSDEDGRIKFFCSDTQLGSIDLDVTNPDPRFHMVSLVIEEETESGGGVLACSCFESVAPKVARAIMVEPIWLTIPNLGSTYTLRVTDLYMFQNDPHEPTYLRLYMNGFPPTAEGEDPYYIQIRERPVGADRNCSNLGPVFESRPYFDDALPEIDGVIQTGERDFLGELRNKVPLDRVVPRTSWLPLFGPHTVIGRSLVLHDNQGGVLGCATISEYYPSVDLRRESLSGFF